MALYISVTEALQNMVNYPISILMIWNPEKEQRTQNHGYAVVGESVDPQIARVR